MHRCALVKIVQMAGEPMRTKRLGILALANGVQLTASVALGDISVHGIGQARLGSFALVIATAAALDDVSAHSARSNWTYPPACCHGDPVIGECDTIPSTTVPPRPDGYVIILRPGDHHRVTRPNRYFVPYDAVIPSGDDNFHICLHPTEEHENCFFAPSEAM